MTRRPSTSGGFTGLAKELWGELQYSKPWDARTFYWRRLGQQWASRECRTVGKLRHASNRPAIRKGGGLKMIMGMFDYLEVKYPLPPPGGHGFQTKEFNCEMKSITITEDGRLILHDYETEVTPKAERPHPDAADDSFDSLIESLRVKSGTERDVIIEHHGDVEIIGQHPNGTDFVLYVVRFTHGRVESIRFVE